MTAHDVLAYACDSMLGDKGKQLRYNRGMQHAQWHVEHAQGNAQHPWTVIKAEPYNVNEAQQQDNLDDKKEPCQNPRNLQGSQCSAIASNSFLRQCQQTQ